MRTRAKVLTVLCIIGCLLLLGSSTAFAQRSYQRSVPVMEDVVYLKDGSIIRGTIIEQIPKESLKIKTADGNVFVYSLDDISKITKEEKPRAYRPAAYDTRYGMQQTPSLFNLRYRFAITIGGGYSSSSGDWFEGLTSGGTFNFGCRFALSNNLSIGMLYKYQELGVGSEYDFSWVDWDVHLQEIYFMVGFNSKPSTYTGPFAFWDFGLGSVGHSITARSTIGYESITLDESKFGLITSAGCIIPFDKWIGIQIDANLRITGEGDTSRYDYYDNSSTGLLLGFGINLIALLGEN